MIFIHNFRAGEIGKLWYNQSTKAKCYKALKTLRKQNKKALKIKAKSTIWSIILASVAFAVVLYAMLPNFAFGSSQKADKNLGVAAVSAAQVFYAYSSAGSQFFGTQSGKIIFNSSALEANVKVQGSAFAPDVQDTYFSFGAGGQTSTGNLAQQTFDLNKVLNAGEQPVIVTNQNGQWSFASPDDSAITAVGMSGLSGQQILVRVYNQQPQQISSYAFSQGTQFPATSIFESSSRAAADMAGSAATAAALLLVVFLAAKVQTQTLTYSTNKFQILRC